MEAANRTGTILIVEDNVDLRELLADVFESNDYDVFTAIDGEDALAVLRIRHVDIVITDLRMPRMDGATFARALKGNALLAHIPIVLLTATPMADTWATLRVFDAFLEKPSPLEDIIEAVRQVRKRGPARSGFLAS